MWKKYNLVIKKYIKETYIYIYSKKIQLVKQQKKNKKIQQKYETNLLDATSFIYIKKQIKLLDKKIVKEYLLNKKKKEKIENVIIYIIIYK